MDEFDLFTPEAAADPYPLYRGLRERGGAAYCPSADAWLVSRHADVAAAFADHTALSSAPGGGSGPRFLLTCDPPDHTDLRKAVVRFFTPRVVADLAGRVRRITEDLLDAAGDTADVMTALAGPLPVLVIAELMGIAPDRAADFKRWSDATVGGVDVDPRALAVATLEMGAFFGDAIADRAATPTRDLIGRLVAHGGMTHRELQMFCGLLLIAGNETTTNLIGNLLRALSVDPDQRALLRADPADAAPRAVEEALRFDAPVQAVWRRAARPYRIGPDVVPRGGRVLLLQGAANRDPDRHPDPDRFDLARAPVGHLGFGAGAHFCLGTHLARLEARTVLEVVVERGIDVEPAGTALWSTPPPRRRDRPRVRRNPVVRGLRSLPLRLGRVRACT
ncbi:cytochrome P450 [Actinosynnema sp. NPDC020468]|uniref:cytochrome P450 n=1 Tax=Actinosynnema sp. NPDC020468 TaxID=3154488 RepID=UPI003400CB05